MNRSNVGNIVTNAVQIGSVGATTYAGLKARWNKEEQDTVLNNTRQQQSDAMYEQKMKNLSAKEQDILASASAKQELGRQRKARADLSEAKLEDYKKKHDEKSVEEQFTEVEQSLIPTVDTPENPNISKKVSSDVQIIERWTRRRIPDSGIHSMKDFYAKLKEQEGKDNADV